MNLVAEAQIGWNHTVDRKYYVSEPCLQEWWKSTAKLEKLSGDRKLGSILSWKKRDILGKREIEYAVSSEMCLLIIEIAKELVMTEKNQS